MNQIQALQEIRKAGGTVWCGMPVRGQHTVYLRHINQTIPSRIWNRLLDRGDLDVAPGGDGGNKVYLVLTEQGKARI